MRKIQGRNEVTINASAQRIWAVLEDSSNVPGYMRAVQTVDVAPGSRERAGATRTCQVELQGRRGEVVERCIELVPNERLTHVCDRDDFGFSRLFDDFGFTFVLQPRGPDATLVCLEGFYRERGLMSRAMNALVMRRKLSGLRAMILSDLKLLVESRGQSAATASSSRSTSSASL
jgi:uncharacterized protein YndB with AHSA1/START domain